MARYELNDVVQFVEKHKWCGTLGFVHEVKPVKTENGEDVRYMIGCTIPDNQSKCNTAYIFSMESEKEFEHLEDGKIVLAPPE